MKTPLVFITAMLFGATMASAQENEIPENGNVGIGTTAPSAPLDVRGQVKADSLRVAGTTTLGDLKIEGLKDENRYENDVALITPDGEIVKGGELKAAVYAQAMKPCKDGNDGFTTPAAPTWTNGPGKLWVNMNCAPDAMVGIGTIPRAKLHIKTHDAYPGIETHAIIVENEAGAKTFQLDENGFVRAREFKVDLESWPDYVFEENYRLLPLERLAQYIAENKHLPNVPTACELETNGLNLAETNIILMEKIEELTLYMIELNKVVIEQQQSIQALQNQLQQK